MTEPAPPSDGPVADGPMQAELAVPSLQPDTTGLVLQREDGVRIVRLASWDDSLAYRAAFAGAYQTVFADPPYNERFFPSEALAVLRAHLETHDHIVLLAVKGVSQVVGFGLCVPAGSRPEVKRNLGGLLPPRQTMYLSELGVLRAHRGSGLGRQLVHTRLALIDRRRYSHAALRTSASRDGAYAMYIRLGFEDMGVYMEVSSRRLDGSVTSDRRLFLCNQLPPPDHDPTAPEYDEDSADPDTWIPVP